ncbi:hypothetical protein OSB04_015168 [Centaurea solstitialis]|uniref:F-box domain-containing protein n=1 Tax=Centaurea solstitialis TaxID=347529 RepID=A0AA38TIF6_9ASTR|nr:hypothetical protein OSB04_015168 [Centaurea solstitialis]
MSLKMLPLDIQFLIIERLPVKSLLRFRSVCKPWNSFISSSGFIAFHHAHSQQYHIISYENLDDDQLQCVSVFNDDQSFALTVPPLVQRKRVVDSSHGLLCMVNSFGRFSETQMAVIWNPAIRRSIAVAVPNMVDHQQFQFDYVVGFGVCPATMDPKLVKVTFIRDPLAIQSISCIPFQVMVFTLSSGQWTAPSTNLPSKSIQFHNYHTVIGQLIYLVGNDWSTLHDDGRKRTLIMSFDLTTHEFAEVDIPNCLHQSYLSVSRLRESLVLLHTDQDLIQYKEVFHVWMMDDGDSKAFTKLFTINPPNAYVWKTLGFRESGEPIIEWTHDETDGTSALGVYEPGLEDIKDLGIRGNNNSFYGCSYIDSLLLLDHDDGRIISSHGLLCMVDSSDRKSETQMAVIWNPAIRRSVAVVVPNVVDPQQFRSIVAFGVSRATMDPKLLKIIFIDDPWNVEIISCISCIPFQVMVFTLSSDRWRCLSTNQLPRKSIQFHNGSQTVIGQFIYLVGYEWSASDGEGRRLIMSFDLTNHEFREVDIPNSLHSHHMTVSRLRESLVLIEYDQIYPNLKQVFHVWMMDADDSKAFTKLFTIDPPNAHVWQTLGFRESGEPIIEWTHDEMDLISALAVYEPGLEDIKDLGIRGIIALFYGSSYKESLLLLDHYDGPALLGVEL